MMEGVYQSLVMFYVPYFCYAGGVAWSSNGLDMDTLVDFGTTVAVNAVVIATFGVLVNYHCYNYFAYLGAFLSLLAILLWIPIYSSFGVFNFADTASRLYASAIFWFTIPVTMFIAIGPRMFIKMFKQMYLPKDRDIIREAVSSCDGSRRPRATFLTCCCSSAVDQGHLSTAIQFDRYGQSRPGGPNGDGAAALYSQCSLFWTGHAIRGNGVSSIEAERKELQSSGGSLAELGGGLKPGGSVDITL
jgi:hypothetical protein